MAPIPGGIGHANGIIPAIAGFIAAAFVMSAVAAGDIAICGCGDGVDLPVGSEPEADAEEDPVADGVDFADGLADGLFGLLSGCDDELEFGFCGAGSERG